MTKDRQKPGPKPYPWDESLGEVRPVGHWLPEEVHKILHKKENKAVIERMALDPEFKAEVLKMVDEE